MTTAWNDVILLCLKHRFCSLLLFVSLLLTAYQSFISKHSSCLALLSFNNLCLFNLLRILSHLIGLWSDSQLPDCKYSYGFIRVRVVAVFSSLVLMALLACCTLRVILVFLLINNRNVLTSCSTASNAFLLGLEVLVLTAVISGTMPASPIDSVVRASTSSASLPLLPSLSALSKTQLAKTWRCRSMPGSPGWGVPHHQLCPVLLLVLGSWLMLVTHSATASFLQKLFEEASTSTFVLLLDTLTALCIMVLAASYLWQPFLLSVRVLMQAVSAGSSSSLQRGLHHAATLAGVLELRSTKVWSLTPHCLRPHSALSSSKSEALVCCVLVRLQRDADPATVVRQLKECLQHCVLHLTIQVYKDEWVEASSAAGLRPPKQPWELRLPFRKSETSAKMSTRAAGRSLNVPSDQGSVLSVLPSVAPNTLASTQECSHLPDRLKTEDPSAQPGQLLYQALPTTLNSSLPSTFVSLSSSAAYTTSAVNSNNTTLSQYSTLTCPPSHTTTASLSQQSSTTSFSPHRTASSLSSHTTTLYTHSITAVSQHSTTTAAYAPHIATSLSPHITTTCLPPHITSQSAVGTSTLGNKQVSPSPHYVNVNLPSYDQDIRNTQTSSRLLSSSALQYQARNDPTRVLPTVSNSHYLEEKFPNFSVDPYKSESHSDSYTCTSNSNVSDDQKSNLNFIQTGNIREHRSDALSDSVFVRSIATNSLLTNTTQDSSKKSSASLHAKWPYSGQHDLDEHAYVNIEFTEKS